MTPARRLTAVLVIAGWAVLAGAQPAEDSLAAARQLYAAAAYEEAVAMLDRLQQSAGSGAADREISLTRALCLLGLGRDADARGAMEALVDLDPRFEFDPADASPRVREMLRGVRAERLPGIIRQRYAAAKQAFDAKDFALAATGFMDVRELLADPLIADQGGLADLRTLAEGFGDLSAKLQAPASPAPASPPPAPAPVPAANAAGTAPDPAPPVMSPAAGTAGAGSPTAANPAGAAGAAPPGASKLVEPVAVSQQPPAWPPSLGFPRVQGYRGTIMVVIDEAGNVTSARIVESVNRVYDALLIDAALRWKYRPATRDGVPIPFTRLVTVVAGQP
jgi:TonB family protein